MKKRRQGKNRIGVFICHCGANIAKTVDVKGIARFARTLPDVVIAKDHEFMCSESGQEMIKDAIANKKLNRVVVASCSPRLHEHTFRQAVSEAGLNSFYFEMANIRENVSWVHYDSPEKATEKAKHIVKGAVGRARRLEAIEKKTVPVEQAVMVIGGGISGIQASLDVAEMGVKVYLVEKEPSIGGNMARLVETFPTGDCAMCILSPKMADVARNPNIDILTYSELVDVKGYIGNFDAVIEKKARYVDEKKCVGCGDCSEKCPVRVKNDWDMGLGSRKAIYLQFPQALPRTYVIDEENCLKLTKNKCGVCKKVCAAGAIDFKQKPEKRSLKIGAIIVATGAQEFDPSGISEYRYGIYDDVVTQLQLARMLDPSGPTGGRVIRPSDGEEPKKYLMLQCVGSRDENHNPYCSRICCMSAIKHAMMIKSEQDPDAEVYISYTDIRTFGKGHEEYYKRACEQGITFIRSRAAEIMQDDKKLIARLENTELGEIITIAPDIVVLSTGLVPNESAEKIAKMLRLETDAYNFLTEKHPKLAPVDSKIEGIYICGTAQGPKDIPDSVAQARAAAVAALRAIVKKTITIDLAKAVVDDELCNGCGICVDACPYEAIEVEDNVEEKLRQGAVVIEALCKACGICASECPTGAIELRHYKSDQMIAQIDGICVVSNEKI